jgi:hypothetical protein
MIALQKELPMRIRIPLASSLALVIALALAPQTYALPGYPVHYTVYYSCHFGPGGCGADGDWYGCLVGEWTHTCNGQWSGWGMRPYTNCAELVDEEIGDPCHPWGEWQSLESASCQGLAVGRQEQILQAPSGAPH